MSESKNRIEGRNSMEKLEEILDELDTGQELIDYNIIKKEGELNDNQEDDKWVREIISWILDND